MSDFYVYVYIDPRNLEEFYFGKGRGSRKHAHLSDASDSEKARRIAAIHADGLEPIVRVVARGLTEHDAFLVEKTLLWKLGRTLTNVSSGHHADKFRPHDKLHLRLPGFDFANGVYYYNVGESGNRHWDDYREFGFISAGQGRRWRDAMLGFEPGDVVAAYLKGCGYVGVGRVLAPAKPVLEAVVAGRPLLSLPLRAEQMDRNADSPEKAEHVCPVEWLAAVDRSAAHWRPRSGLYTTTHVRASLHGQPKTLAFLEERFELHLGELIG